MSVNTSDQQFKELVFISTFSFSTYEMYVSILPALVRQKTCN